MSYYVTNKGNIYEAAAGLGAFVRPVPIAPRDVTYLPISGYQAFKDRPFMYRAVKDAKVRRFGLRGLGETMGYDGAAMWSKQNACNNAWQTSKTTIPACGEWVNGTRAALARLGYGALTQNQRWDAPDQAATKKFAADNGLAVPGNGYPTQAIHMKIEANISAPEPIVTGDKPPIQVEPVPGTTDQYTYKGVVASAEGELKKTGLSTAQLALIGVGLVGIAAVAIAVKRRGKTRAVTSGQAIQAPLPGAVPAGAKA